MTKDPATDDVKRSDGCGIFVKLPNKIALQFPPRPEEDKSPPHITILYIGKKTPKEVEKIKNIVKNELKDFSSLKCKLDGVDYLETEDDKIVAYAKIKCPELKKIHNKLRKAIEDAGIEVEHFPGFIAHSTLEYRDDKNYTGPEPSGEFEINELEMWFEEGKVQETWTLEEEWVKRINNALFENSV